MFTAMEESVDLINNNGGFTFVGCYNRGVIKNKSLIAARNTSDFCINSGNKNFHSTEVDVQID